MPGDEWIPFRGGLALTMACAIWGGLYVVVVSKAVMNVLPPLPLVWLRFLMGTIVMAPVVLWQREKITPGQTSAGCS